MALELLLQTKTLLSAIISWIKRTAWQHLHFIGKGEPFSLVVKSLLHPNITGTFASKVKNTRIICASLLKLILAKVRCTKCKPNIGNSLQLWSSKYWNLENRNIFLIFQKKSFSFFFIYFMNRYNKYFVFINIMVGLVGCPVLEAHNI